jgi:hypothetical protein
MKFKKLVNTQVKEPKNKLKIIIKESHLRYIIDKLTEEQIKYKISEHNSLKLNQNGNS